ncbi:MAG: Bacterial type secretion system protein [Verrucomicrobia bacterium]|nr:Bacterial type secretion system protein [Verrucomicrobiota bacterium]
MNPAQPDSSAVSLRIWPRRRRALILGLCGIALLILLFFGLGQLQRQQTQRKIDAKLAAIRAQGLPVNLTELNAFYLSVPDADNAALLLNQVSRNIVNWPYYDPLIGISPTSLLHATNPITPVAQTALSDLIRSNQTALKLIYDATTRTQFRYPIDLAKNSQVPTDHWGEMKKIVQLLRLESIHHLASGNKPDALKSVEASLFVTRSMDGEPFISSYLVQYACLSITLTGLEQLLQRTEFPATDLQHFQETIAAMEGRHDLLRILHGYDEGGHKEADLLNFLNLCEKLLAAAEQHPATAFTTGKELENRLYTLGIPSFDMIKTSARAHSLVLVFPKQAGMLATLRTAQTALAVERFRLENNRLPQSLGELIPRYLTKAPMDPFNEQPLLYRSTQTGFRIYSAGENGKDDGGQTRAEKSYPENDDMVFAVERLK